MLFTNSKAALGVALASALITSSAYAAPKKASAKPVLLAAATPATVVASPGSTSAVSASDVAPSAFSKITAGVATTLVGPRVSNPASSFTNDNGYNTEESKIFFDSVANVGYKLDGGKHISLNLPFYYKPLGNITREVPAGLTTQSSESLENKYGNDIETFDTYVRLKGINFVKTDNLSIGTDARAVIPVKAQSRIDGLVTQLRINPNLDYKLSGTRWSLGLATTFRAYVYADPTRSNVPGKANNPRKMRAYAGPSINYQLSDKVAINLVYEMAAENRYRVTNADGSTSDAGMLNWVNEGTDFRPAVSIDVMSGLYLAPYLEIATGGRIAPETTKIGFDLAYSIL